MLSADWRQSSSIGASQPSISPLRQGWCGMGRGRSSAAVISFIPFRSSTSTSSISSSSKLGVGPSGSDTRLGFLPDRLTTAEFKARERRCCCAEVDINTGLERNLVGCEIHADAVATQHTAMIAIDSDFVILLIIACWMECSWNNLTKFAAAAVS